jgi:hypothetical protein
MIKRWGIRLARTVLAGIALFSVYTALLCVPQPFFSHSVRAGSVKLYSDRPLQEAAARNVLRLALDKLATCPLYAGHPDATVYICNSRWRQVLFFNKHYGVAGVSPYPLTTNVFLRDAAVEDNRLISPRGLPVPGTRTLDYFVAHELTHELTGRLVGPLGFYKMPQWIREGYADYVGKGTAFNYAEARQAFLADVPEMDFHRSGLYWRFNLLVAYLLDHQHWTVDRLLHEPWPAQQQMESAIRAEKQVRVTPPL